MVWCGVQRRGEVHGMNFCAIDKNIELSFISQLIRIDKSPIDIRDSAR